MNKSFIDELYYGRVAPWENRSIDTDKEKYQWLETEIEYLKTQLDESDRNILEDVINTITEDACDERREGFRIGFSIGIRAIFDAMNAES